MHNRNVLWIALVALWLGGCGGDTRGPEPPPAGVVELVAAAPLNAAWYAPNRIPNGHFERWQTGEAAPDEFRAPEQSFSLIDNAAGKVRQTWLRTDVLHQPDNLFRARVALRSGVVYQLAVLAESEGDGVAALSLWRVPNEGGPEMVDPALLTLLPGSGLMKKYALSFEVPEGGMYMLASHATVAPESSFRVTWHRWHLTPKPEAAS